MPVAIKKWLSVFRPHWDTKHVNEVGLAGKKDEEIFQWAQNHQSIIITFDEDFADARGFVQTPHAGIIRLKIWPTTFEEAITALTRLFETLDDRELKGALVIVETHKIRVRRK